MRDDRIEWVDLSRGIGILLVIIGHCVYYGKTAHNWIFSFHMQLFFILSGMFFQEDSILNTVKKKAKSLLIPYAVFCMIGLCVTLLIPQWRGITLKDLARDIYWGYPAAVNVSSVWFLVCLFVTICIFDVVIRIRNKNKTIGFILLAIIVIYGFALARFPQILAIFPGHRMPWESDSACVAVLFLAFGYFFNTQIMNTVEKLKSGGFHVIIIGLCVSLGITIAVVFLNGTVNLRGLMYHNELIYIIGACAGFSFVVFLSILTSKRKYLRQWIRWFGENSLEIMGTQALMIRLYILVINSVLGESYSLYLLPKPYAVTGIFVVTICSGVLVTLFNLMQSYLRKK